MRENEAQALYELDFDGAYLDVHGASAGMVCARAGSRLHLHELENKDGTFRVATYVAEGGMRASVPLTDLNRNDVVVSMPNDNWWKRLPNTDKETVPADFILASENTT